MTPTRLIALGLVLLLSGCTAVVYRVAVPFLYRAAPLPAAQITRDVRYWDGPDADPKKHRLDLFQPTGSGWPVMVFIHGGGWTTGDKGLRVGGADLYGNIGRFYAARGIGVAVISYRLQPKVAWPDQVSDAARAVAWVHGNVARFGGDPERLVLMGHSAGGQLATRLALDPAPLAALGIDHHVVKGLVSVSGAGLDLTDAESWRLGQPRGYYAQRFQNGDRGDAWMRAASPVRFAGPGAPPALVIYAEGDPPELRRQSQVLDTALRAAGGSSELVIVPGSSHTRILLTLSRADAVAARAILRFVELTLGDARV